MTCLQLAAITLALVVGPMAHAITMEELHELQKNRYAESLKESSDKDRAARTTARPTAENLLPAQGVFVGKEAKEMRLTGLYGVGNDIEARIAYRGASIPLKLGMDVDGWVLTDIGERTVQLTKSNAANTKSKHKPKTITLRIASVVREYPAAPSSTTAGIMPAPLPTANAIPGRRPFP